VSSWSGFGSSTQLSTSSAAPSPSPSGPGSPVELLPGSPVVLLLVPALGSVSAVVPASVVPELVAPTPELAASVSDESEPPVVVPGSLVGLVSLLGEPVVGALLVDRAVASPEDGLLSELWVSCPSGAAEEQAVSTDKLTAVSNE